MPQEEIHTGPDGADYNRNNPTLTIIGTFLTCIVALVAYDRLGYKLGLPPQPFNITYGDIELLAGERISEREMIIENAIDILGLSNTDVTILRGSELLLDGSNHDFILSHMPVDREGEYRDQFNHYDMLHAQYPVYEQFGLFFTHPEQISIDPLTRKFILKNINYAASSRYVITDGEVKQMILFTPYLRKKSVE